MIRFAAGLVLPILLVIAWETAVRAGLFPPSQAAAPAEIVQTVARLLRDSEFLIHIGVSLARLLTGVLVGSALGILVGTFIAAVPIARYSVNPLFGFLAGLPVVVWMPFWIMTFGIGETFRIGLVSIAAFFLVYTVSFTATRRASGTYLEVLQLFEKQTGEALHRVYIPMAAAQLFTAVRLSLALGWIILFFVEYAVSNPGTEGLGWFINQARSVGRIEEEFAGLVVLGIVAFLVDSGVATIQRSRLRWADAIEDRAS